MRTKPLRSSWRSATARLALLALLTLSAGAGCCSETTTNSPIEWPHLPPGKPEAELRQELARKSETWADTGPLTTLPSSDLELLIAWGRRWEAYALACERAGRWKR